MIKRGSEKDGEHTQRIEQESTLKLACHPFMEDMGQMPKKARTIRVLCPKAPFQSDRKMTATRHVCPPENCIAYMWEYAEGAECDPNRIGRRFLLHYTITSERNPRRWHMDEKKDGRSVYRACSKWHRYVNETG